MISGNNVADETFAGDVAWSSANRIFQASQAGNLRLKSTKDNMLRTTHILTAAIPLLIAGTMNLSARDGIAQAKKAPVPAANQGRAPSAPNNTGNGPSANPNARFNGPAGANRNQNPSPGLQNNRSLNNLEHTRGATIPLGNLGFGNLNNVPWFLPFGGFSGYGFDGSGFGPYGSGFNTGYSGVSDTNGYYGVGSGGFGYDNLAGSGLYVSDTSAAATGNVANDSPSTPEQQRQMLENAKGANSLYYQFREANRAYRARQISRDRASPEAVAKTAIDNLPRSLGSDELDQAAGKIAWPAQLAKVEYAPLRAAVEEQFRLRSQGDSPGSTKIIKQSTQDMVELLRTQIEDMPAEEFLTARKFLDSLDYATHKSVPR